MTTLRKRHDLVAEALRGEISLSRPGDRLETEPSLASRFGVSVPTIRNALLLLEREGLLQRRQGSGTYVCHLPQDRHIGITINVEGFQHAAAHAFHLGAAHGVWKRLESAGWRLKFYADANGETGEELLNAAQTRRLAALIVLRMMPVPLSESLRNAGVHLIGNDNLATLRVEFDNDGMVRKGLNALMNAGRRHIAFLGWGAPNNFHLIGDVFRQQAAGLGLPVQEAWIHDELRPDNPGAGWEEFREIWMARPEKPDGILVCDDVLYRDAAIAIREFGIRVPEELMVVTHFNKGTITPHDFPVTLLEADTEAYADAVAEGTLAILRGKTPPHPLTVLEHEVRCVPMSHQKPKTQIQEVEEVLTASRDQTGS